MRLRFVLFVAFIVVPVTEIALLVWFGQTFGFWVTVLLVLITAVLGSFLLAKQGSATVRRVMAETREGRVPAKSLADGAMLLVAGAFLLTPGLLTDATGLALLVPGVRAAIRGWIGIRVQRRFFLEP
jgi:UPF0716 protein FxsA